MPGITTWIITRIWSRNKPCYRHLQIFDITPHTQHEQHKQLPKKNNWIHPFCVGILLVPCNTPTVGLWPCISLAKHDCHLSVPMKLPRSGSRLRFHLSRGEQWSLNGQPTLPYPPGVTCPPHKNSRPYDPGFLLTIGFPLIRPTIKTVIS